ncbi:MAG: aminotransferase family protein [Vulcanimicrobiaceae bacterium]
MLSVDSHLWLPFTQMQSFGSNPRTFVRGAGTSLTDARGHRVFDATSSIWTILHGHGHPRIVEAIARQAERLDHATTLGANNPPAEELAGRLCGLAGMDYAFFGGDGASAVEAALKMALQYWQNVGHPERTRFVRLVDAYHGDTTGAMSLSDITVFKQRFAGVLFESIPYESVTGRLGDDVAGIIVEPLIQAAAGMRLVPRELYATLRERDTLLIVDEIATGFGRTGSMFAFSQLGLEPDLLCLGKGLSGGVLALCATLARRTVYEAFLGDQRSAKHFFHGHSFAGNPIACAAGLASLACFEEEGTLERVRRLAEHAAVRLALLRDHPLVRDVRQAGLMIGIEVRSESIDAGSAASSAWRIADGLYERGHFTRPIGDVVQLVPPLCSQPDEIDAFCDALERELEGCT